MISEQLTILFFLKMIKKKKRGREEGRV